MNKYAFVVSIAISSILVLGAINVTPMTYAGTPETRARAAEEPEREAPVVITGDNVYIVWFTNESTVNSNFEVGFRASNNSGATFGPITNLSNTDNADSVNAEISAEGGNIIVSWWERNQTAMIPVARVSTDNGQTFGNRLNITASPFEGIGEAVADEEE